MGVSSIYVAFSRRVPHTSLLSSLALKKVASSPFEPEDTSDVITRLQSSGLYMKRDWEDRDERQAIMRNACGLVLVYGCLGSQRLTCEYRPKGDPLEYTDDSPGFGLRIYVTPELFVGQRVIRKGRGHAGRSEQSRATHKIVRRRVPCTLS